MCLYMLEVSYMVLKCVWSYAVPRCSSLRHRRGPLDRFVRAERQETMGKKHQEILETWMQFINHKHEGIQHFRNKSTRKKQSKPSSCLTLQWKCTRIHWLHNKVYNESHPPEQSCSHTHFTKPVIVLTFPNSRSKKKDKPFSLYVGCKLLDRNYCVK